MRRAYVHEIEAETERRFSASQRNPLRLIVLRHVLHDHHRGMRCNSQIAHHGRPAKTEEFCLLHTGLQKSLGPLVIWTVSIRGVQQDVHIERKTHGWSVPSVA